MKRMMMLAVIGGLALTWAGPVQAQSLFGDDDGQTSLFQDRKPRRASRIGDILTVLVTETTSATNRARTETSKESTTNINSQGGTGPLGFIPALGLTGNSSSGYQGEGSTTRSQQLQARVSVTVVGLKPNGDLIVEGNRIVEINGEREVIYMSGAVNPKIIPATNTIESYRISDFQVSYKGKGVVHDGSRPGVIARIFNWIF